MAVVRRVEIALKVVVDGRGGRVLVWVASTELMETRLRFVERDDRKEGVMRNGRKGAEFGQGGDGNAEGDGGG